jgi:hypothetical protein
VALTGLRNLLGSVADVIGESASVGSERSDAGFVIALVAGLSEHGFVDRFEAHSVSLAVELEQHLFLGFVFSTEESGP